MKKLLVISLLLTSCAVTKSAAVTRETTWRIKNCVNSHVAQLPAIAACKEEVRDWCMAQRSGADCVNIWDQDLLRHSLHDYLGAPWAD